MGSYFGSILYVKALQDVHSWCHFLINLQHAHGEMKMAGWAVG